MDKSTSVNVLSWDSSRERECKHDAVVDEFSLSGAMTFNVPDILCSPV